MLDSGQPLHAFDLDKIIEVSPTGRPDIIVRAASKGETLELLDGRTIALSPADIVVQRVMPRAVCQLPWLGRWAAWRRKSPARPSVLLLESATFDLYHLARYAVPPRHL